MLPLLDAIGEVPLPPYLGRDAEPDDIERYQTVYAKEAGAVAAPTAGLHFDEEMLEQTLAAGVRHAWVTLHVGAGTFQALRREHIEENRLHSERIRVPESCCEAVMETRAAGGALSPLGPQRSVPWKAHRRAARYRRTMAKPTCSSSRVTNSGRWTR